MTVIYADVLVVINAYITLLLLLAVAAVTGAPVKGWRLLLGSLLGGAAGMLFFIADYPLAALFANLAVASAEIPLTFGKSGVRAFVKKLLVFCATGVIFAGAAMLVKLWQPDAVSVGGGAIYFEVSPLLLIGSAGGCYAVIRLILLLTAARDSREPCRVSVRVGGRSVTLNALSDSGNLLRDAVTDSPVAVACLKGVSALLPPEMTEFFCRLTCADCDGEWHSRVRVIPCSGIGGEKMLGAFRPDSVTVFRGNREFRADNLHIAVTPGCLDGEYEILLPAEAGGGRE